ncbi:MAG: hypothetical protein AB7V16_13315, partial [Vulcanibacillus sp.]
ISSGTGSPVRKYVGYNIDIAGKTGTTNDNKDAWFIGYSPEVTLGVWVGYDYPVSLPNASIASQTWGRLFAEILKVDPDLSPISSTFKMPTDIVKMEVSKTSGKLPSDLTREAGYLVTDWFNKKYIPTEVDDSLERASIVYYDGKRYIAKPETPEDMVEKGIFFKREPYVIPEPEDGKAKKAYPDDYNKELPNEVDPRISNDKLPEPPTSIILKTQENQNILSWNKNLDPNIVGYRVYRSTILNLGFKYVGSVPQKSLNGERMYFEDKAGKYAYYIVSVDIDGKESIQSEYIGNSINIPPEDEDIIDEDNVPLAIPSAPHNLNFIHIESTTQVTLTWVENDSNEYVTRYNIYFGNDKDGPFTLVNNTKNTLYSHNFGEQEKVYYYITAVNQLGESQHSNIIEVAVKTEIE